MSLPVSPHGNRYLEHLRQFRDSACVESHWFGRRKSLGGFTFGAVCAQWQSEEGGRAVLVDTGVRRKNSNLTAIKPTTLRLYSSYTENRLECTTFTMDIDDIGCIDIFRNMITSGTFREIVKADLYKRADKKHGLSVPTDEERELLYTEMQRGATGLYPVVYDLEDED